MAPNRYRRAIAQFIAMCAAAAAIEVFFMRGGGLISRHVRDSLRPGMTVVEVMRATGGRFAAHAYPESAPEGHGFTIYTYGIVRDDSDRGQVLGGFTKPEDLAARIEEEMKKQPGSWLLVFGYHTMDRGWDSFFTVTIGADLRVRQTSDVWKRRSQGPGVL